MWQLSIHQKRLPLDIVIFFLTQLQSMDRSVQYIYTDCEGGLTGSSEFCAVIKNNFQVGLEQTGTYSSWLNYKTGQHIQTVCRMLRLETIGHSLGDELWCYKCED